MVRRLAIVGGGPKAVAIAAKAEVLQEEGLLDCEIHVFESKEIGASWTGRHGYTDGEQALCTPAEKDLGFPYAEMPGAPEAAEKMMARYSWGTFKASRGYADWVDLGRRRASHREFAEYLMWAFDRSGAALHLGEVTRLERARITGRQAREGWKVEWKEGAGKAQLLGTFFDGVVVTGHGPARPLGPTNSPRMLDGQRLWTKRERDRALGLLGTRAVSEDAPLVVIGSGGTAAAVLAWLARQGHRDLPIYLLAEQATFYSRGNSVFENRLFSDPTQWKALTHATRKAFFERLTRGVVWDAVMEELVQLSALKFIDGRATDITAAGAGNLTLQWKRNLSQLELDLGDEETHQVEAGLVINATGFDNWWFLRLLPPGAIPSDRKERADLLERLAHGMGEDLTFRDGWTLPRLHAPFQSMLVGPGFASLLALGDMADRVLRPYMK
ncbi:SidA/IucD/PvdA family monooxygenase [Siccirubricoccus phaeus]|uniref:SidA/IucD/PvdA family monooxygenase n=1 Tax=Siccirubricoccus phaeus TaxID=2595053 RepID=UPI00165CCC63|nr:SidA/IucD/PvdA family monooxygenase [Siccirubricoccus phaeus]